jgi:signal transduction histidine kinase
LVWATAWVIQRQQRLLAELDRAQARLAEEAAAAERARIAREVHDVVAHSLTVTLLHLSSARLALADRPGDAARALVEAERLARESLADVRRTVGLLGRDGEGGVVGPLPGAADLGRLVAGFRAAGVAVDLRVEGDVGGLAPGHGLGLYRIVEESVANAARHAPGAAVEVVVAARAGEMVVTVANGPPVRGADPAGGSGLGVGLGLAGMRERAALLGGRLVAGPAAGGGWRVEAVLPAGDPP